MILLAFGTRPEYLKIKPLIKEFDKEKVDYKLLFTGQHIDLLKEVQVDQALNIQKGKNRLDSIVSSIMNNIKFNDINYVLIQGDTSSVASVALSAFHHQIPVIHLEAGLRTYDKQNPYPEETNRRITSSIADYHLCPTQLAKDNLLDERTEGKIEVVGNTVLDNLLEWKDKCEYNNKILVTLHRRENWDSMQDWMNAINEIALNNKEYEFIMPVHPNSKILRYRYTYEKNIKLVDPLPHNELLEVLTKSKLVITDSGGIQEESSFFNKICLTCRKVTERPEAIGQSTYLVKTPLELPTLFDKFVDNYEIDFESPFGDGHSAQKIVNVLKDWKII